jgi:hypothetical protein
MYSISDERYKDWRALDSFPQGLEFLLHYMRLVPERIEFSPPLVRLNL